MTDEKTWTPAFSPCRRGSKPFRSSVRHGARRGTASLQAFSAFRLGIPSSAKPLLLVAESVHTATRFSFTVLPRVAWRPTTYSSVHPVAKPARKAGWFGEPARWVVPTPVLTAPRRSVRRPGVLFVKSKHRPPVSILQVGTAGTACSSGWGRRCRVRSSLSADAGVPGRLRTLLSSH